MSESPMTNSISEALKPCPFCLGPAVNVADDYTTCGNGLKSDCAGHMVRTDPDTWNTRVDTGVDCKLINDLRRALESCVTSLEYAAGELAGTPNQKGKWAVWSHPAHSLAQAARVLGEARASVDTGGGE